MKATLTLKMENVHIKAAHICIESIWLGQFFENKNRNIGLGSIHKLRVDKILKIFDPPPPSIDKFTT